jgi:hypothetical protein
MLIKQAEFRRAARGVGVDDEVEAGWHNRCPCVVRDA